MVVVLALLGALTVVGLLAILVGSRARLRKTWRLPRVSWRSPGVIGLALLGLGIVFALISGWLVAIVVLPLIGLGLPYLVGKSAAELDIAKLEAMEEWTRSLSGVLTAGAGLEQSLVATLGSTPPPIQPAVSRLVARLRARWSTPTALRAFADDLDDPTGDILAANLLLGAQRRGDGLATILEGLAETVALDVRARRQVEADAAKPRATARWVTIITAVVLGGLFLTGSYVAAYKVGIGQLVLLSLLGAYAGVLVWMRRIARGAKTLRLLGDQAKRVGG